MHRIRFFVEFKPVYEATAEVRDDFADLINKFLDKYRKAMSRERKIINHYYIIESKR